MNRFYLILLLLPSPVLAQWPTTEWHVQCTTVTRIYLEGELGEEATAFECNDRSVSGAAAVARDQLTQASAWLEGLGFREPHAELSDGRYLAWIAKEHQVRGDIEAWGVYRPLDDTEIVTLNPDYWIVVIEEGGIPGEVLRTYSAVHELFHAVQFNYFTMDAWLSGRWIIEGGAEAVQMAWFRKNSSEPFEESDPWLSDTLYQRRDSYENYRISYFWTGLGQDLSDPEIITYLQDVYQENLSPGHGIDGLHNALLGYHTHGLYEAYPQFIALHGDSPLLYDADLGAYRTDAIDLDRSYVESAYDGTINAIAANAYDIEVSNLNTNPASITVTLEGDQDALHLTVNQGLYNDWERGADKHNVYEAILPGGGRDTTLQIRIANISTDPARSTDQDYTLKVALERVQPCGEASLSASLNPYTSEGQTEVQRMEIQRDGMLLLDTENVVYTLGQAEYSINGGGGVACVSFFAVSDLEWMHDQDPNPPDAEDEMERIVARHMPRAIEETGLTESQIRAVLEGNMPAGASQAQLMRLMRFIREVAAEPQSDLEENSGVYFHIFEPSLLTMMGGIAPESLGEKEGVVTHHGGVGGWRPNSASNLIVYLPGTQASEIEAGGSYNAVAYSQSDQPMPGTVEGPETLTAFYTWWDGEFRDFRCYGERTNEFDGIQQSIWGQLEGTVQIDSVSPTAITGSFNLSGRGQRETLTYNLERTGDINCSYRQEIEEDFGSVPIFASGSFNAPNFGHSDAPHVPIVIAGQGRAAPMGR